MAGVPEGEGLKAQVGGFILADEKGFLFFLTQQRWTAMVAGRSLSVGTGRAQGSYAQEPIDSRGVSNLLAEPETGSASALTRVLAPWIRDFLLTALTRPFPTRMPRSTVVTFLFLLGLPHPRASCRAQSTLGIRYLCQTFLRVFTLPSSTSTLFSQPLHWQGGGGGGACLSTRPQETSKHLVSLQVLGFSFPHPLTYEEMEDEKKHGTRGMCGRKRVANHYTFWGFVPHANLATFKP